MAAGPRAEDTLRRTVTTPDPSPTPPVSLVRGLGPFAAYAMVVGNVIGTGVFLKARVMTCNVDTPGHGHRRVGRSPG